MTCSKIITVRFILFCALSSQIEAQKAVKPESINVEENRTFGINLENILLKLKKGVGKGIDSVYKVLIGIIDESDKLLNEASENAIPAIGEKVIDFGKVLVGLREQLGGDNVDTNVCLIDVASKRIDSLPDDLGKLILLCRNNFADKVKSYAGDVKDLLEKANNETYSIVDGGLQCLQGYTFGCVTETASKAAIAAIRIPGEIAYLLSKTGSLFLVLPKQGAFCISAALEKMIKRGQKYVRLVKQCWDKKFTQKKLYLESVIDV